MKFRIVYFIIVILFVLSFFSCHNDGGKTVNGEVGLPCMSQHIGQISLVGDELYLTATGYESLNTFGIWACESSSESFTPYTPCYIPDCMHNSDKCCAFISHTPSQMKLLAYEDEGEPVLILQSSRGDIAISKPLSNEKIFLTGKDYQSSKKANVFIYGDYLYFSQKSGDEYVQYRATLASGKVERVFDQNNIVVKTIINNKYYGMIYSDDSKDISSRPNGDTVYFRSDMNYENIEALPEMFEFFSTPGDDFLIRATAILDADEQNIYVLYQQKIWAIADENIYDEPRLISCIEDQVLEDYIDEINSSYYKDGKLYFVFRRDPYDRKLLNAKGEDQRRQWWSSSHFYSFDIMTGELCSWDISSQQGTIRELYYADGKYIYGKGIYVHQDGRSIDGLIMRLNLETMEFESKIYPEFFDHMLDTTK